MFGDPIDTPIMDGNDYQRIMGKISTQYSLLKECPTLNTNYVQGLMLNLNPSYNPESSQGLFDGLERIINNER